MRKYIINNYIELQELKIKPTKSLIINNAFLVNNIN